jgi:hypothetical protein
MSQVENALRRAVRASGMTVHAVAVATGVPQPVLRKFVRGDGTIQLPTAQRLCDYFRLVLMPLANGRAAHRR